MNLTPEPNARGFAVAAWADANGYACSIQESSAAPAPLLWLGLDEGVHAEHPTAEGRECCARMHLTREMVAALLPLLERFVETGELCR